jgi:hypothetical protein
MDYLGLINSSRGLLTDSVICFLLVSEHLMRHPYVIPDVTSKTLHSKTKQGLYIDIYNYTYIEYYITWRT